MILTNAIELEEFAQLNLKFLFDGLFPNEKGMLFKSIEEIHVPMGDFNLPFVPQRLVPISYPTIPKTKPKITFNENAFFKFYPNYDHRAINITNPTKSGDTELGYRVPGIPLYKIEELVIKPTVLGNLMDLYWDFLEFIIKSLEFKLKYSVGILKG